MTNLDKAIQFISGLKRNNPHIDKEAIMAQFAKKFLPTLRRSVFTCDGFCMRFSKAKPTSFSSTVLSLSTLKIYDSVPFVVVVIRPESVNFLLANSTFIKKISQTSHKLCVENILGSFNGTDILKEYDGLRNAPENFSLLFEKHKKIEWIDNLERIVAETNAIVGHNNRFQPTSSDKSMILQAPERALATMKSSNFTNIQSRLQNMVAKRKDQIINAAAVDNVNIRGNTIEQLLTGQGNAHSLGDLVEDIGNGLTLAIDIKTKLLNRASAPKAYNIDKMLEFLANPGSVFAFFLVVIDVENKCVFSRLLPIFETTLLEATKVDYRFAARASRGATMFSGNFYSSIDPDYKLSIDVAKAKSAIEGWLSL